VLELLGEAIRRTVERGGLYCEIRTCISRGCPLSPLLGALYLRWLDERMEAHDLYYVRYMDDVLVLTKTHWQLRRAVRILNRTFRELKVLQHPDKTLIGRIEKGFDFLGYYYSREYLQVAIKTVSNFAERLHRLYEQKKTAPDLGAVLGEYVVRWLRGCLGGIGTQGMAGSNELGAAHLPMSRRLALYGPGRSGPRRPPQT